MAIAVVCPGCRTRFRVSEKFAGRKGPCPKCKTEITVPAASDEVVIHGPENSGAKGAKGRAVLQPIFREYTKFSPTVAAGCGIGVLMVVAIALIVRISVEDKSQLTPLLAIGALAVAPPLVWAGYAFLRNEDLEPYRGKELWVRVAICSVLYALIWGVIAFINWYALESEGYSLPLVAVFVPLMIVAGGGACFVSLDMEFFTGLMHYGLYLGATVLLRLLTGIPPFPMSS